MKSEKQKAWARKWYKENHAFARAQHAEWRAKNQEKIKSWNIRYKEQTKREVLSHYGPEGKMQCGWGGCEITDPDMLSLDHINDDGAAQRKAGIQRSGVSFYGNLRKNGYPSGYQTLCHNHQWKKQIMKVRVKG